MSEFRMTRNNQLTVGQIVCMYNNESSPTTFVTTGTAQTNPVTYIDIDGFTVVLKLGYILHNVRGYNHFAIAYATVPLLAFSTYLSVHAPSLWSEFDKCFSIKCGISSPRLLTPTGPT